MALNHNMPMHSRTYCQATQANPKTQAWQRVCLSNRTRVVRTQYDRPSPESRTATNNTYPKGGFRVPKTVLRLQKYGQKIPKGIILYFKNHEFINETLIKKMIHLQRIVLAYFKPKSIEFYRKTTIYDFDGIQIYKKLIIV